MSLDKWSETGEVNIRVQGLRCWEWRWSRELTQQELVSLSELKEITEKVELKVNDEDKGSWADGMSKTYSVRNAYKGLVSGITNMAKLCMSLA